MPHGGRELAVRDGAEGIWQTHWMSHGGRELAVRDGAEGRWRTQWVPYGGREQAVRDGAMPRENGVSEKIDRKNSLVRARIQLALGKLIMSRAC